MSKCCFMERVQITNLRSCSSYLQPHPLANHPTIFRWLMHAQSSRFTMMMQGMQKTEFQQQCMHLSKPKQTVNFSISHVQISLTSLASTRSLKQHFTDMSKEAGAT